MLNLKNNNIKKNIPAIANIQIINGPNLNLLGRREPEIYGFQDFDSYLNYLKNKYPQINFSYFQSNFEGQIVEQLQKALDSDVDGIILNAGAFSHYSYAIYDAIKLIRKPVIEVHISNIFSREPFRSNSILSPVVTGIISGFGLHSYEMAVVYLLNLKNEK